MQQSYTIKHRLRKNLPQGTLYNSQIAALLFAIGLAFKLSAAPGIISQEYGSSTLWLYLVMTMIELMVCVLIFLFARGRGDSFLMAINSPAYRLICALTSLLMTLKATVYFCFCASYLSHELFSGVEPYLLYIVFLLPIIYLGIKGIKTLARCAEIFSILIFAVIIINLIFLDTDMDFGRNLPIFAIEPTDFFMGMGRYGLWLGDCIPFMFVRIKNKRMPYVSLSVATTSLLVNIIIMLGVAMYGDALKMTTDLLIHIAAFNQLSLEIGRMEWTNLFAMLIISIFSIALLYRGAIDACERAIRAKLPAQLLFPIALACFAIFIPSARDVTDFATGYFGYVFFALAISIPIMLIASLVYHKHKLGNFYKYFECEYVVESVRNHTPSSSLADGILKGYKHEASTSQQISPNGTLNG